MMDFSSRKFSVADYAVFAAMLLVSAVVGIYYAVKDRKKQNTEEYLLAGRSMSAYPVSFSLVVSFMSAVTVLGTPAEVYRYGIIYSWIIPGVTIMSLVTAEIYVPTFYKLKLGSVYEYLEKRFSRSVRYEGTMIYMVQTFLYIGIVIYGPALALNAVTGLNIWGAVISTGLVCTFYSSLGGLKAVIWTDAFQGVVMVAGFLSVIIMGCMTMGGYGNIWRLSVEGGRDVLWRFDFDPRVRQSVWSVTIGFTFMFMSLYAVNQGQVQRYLSCKSTREAKKALWLNIVGLWILNIMAVTCGLVIYAYYKECDPISFGVISKADQLLPYMVLDIFQHLPGLSGLFIACVYSGSLSTVSTAITAMASVTIEDFLKPFFSLKETTYTWIAKGLVMTYGLLCIALAFLMSKFSGLISAALSVLSLTGGPLVGLYSLGLLFPFANTAGVLVGTNVGLAMNVLVIILRFTQPPPPPEFANALSLTTQGCPINNITKTSFPPTIATDISGGLATMSSPVVPTYEEGLNALSTYWYAPYGCIWTIVVGALISLLTGGWKTRKDVDPRLLYYFFDHWLFKWLPQGWHNKLRCGLPRVDAEEKEHGAGEVLMDTKIIT